MNNQKQKVDYYRDRAKTSFEYIVKTIIGISMAAIATFFIIFTKEVNPPLSDASLYLASSSFIMFVLSVLFGFAFVYINLAKYKSFDSRRNLSDHEFSEVANEIQRRHKPRQRTISVLWGFCFITALLLTFSFVMVRMYGI